MWLFLGAKDGFLRDLPRALWAGLLLLGCALLLPTVSATTVRIQDLLPAERAVIQLRATDNAVALSIQELGEAIAMATPRVSSEALTFGEISELLESAVGAVETSWAARYLKYFEISLRLHCVTTPFSEGDHIAHLDSYDAYQVPLAKCVEDLTALAGHSIFLQPMLERLDLLQQQLQISERHHRYSGVGTVALDIEAAKNHAARYYLLANDAVRLAIILQHAASLLQIATRDEASHINDPSLSKAVHQVLVNTKPLTKSFLKSFNAICDIVANSSVDGTKNNLTNLFVCTNVPLDISPLKVIPKIQEFSGNFYASLERPQPHFVTLIGDLDSLLKVIPHRISDTLFGFISQMFSGDRPEVLQEYERITSQDWTRELERRQGILEHLRTGLISPSDPCILQLYKWYTGERAAYLSGIVTNVIEAQKAAMEQSLAIFSKAELAPPALEKLSEGKVALCYPSLARMYALFRLEEMANYPQLAAHRDQSTPLQQHELDAVMSDAAAELVEKIFFVGNFYDSLQDLESWYEKVETALLMALGTLGSPFVSNYGGLIFFSRAEVQIVAAPLRKQFKVVGWRIRFEKPS